MNQSVACIPCKEVHRKGCWGGSQERKKAARGAAFRVDLWASLCVAVAAVAA